MERRREKGGNQHEVRGREDEEGRKKGGGDVPPWWNSLAETSTIGLSVVELSSTERTACEAMKSLTSGPSHCRTTGSVPLRSGREVVATHLRRSPERVAILPQRPLVLLNRNLLLMLRRKLRSRQHRPNVPRDLDLLRVRTSRVVEEGVEGTLSADEGFDGESREGLREEGEELGVVKGESGERGGDGGAVDESEACGKTRGEEVSDARRTERVGGRRQRRTFLRSENDGLDTEQRHRLPRRQDLVLPVVDNVYGDVGVASNCAGDVREGREVSRRRDGATERDDGRDTEVEELDESVEDDETDGGVTSGETVDANEHRAPDDLEGEGVLQLLTPLATGQNTGVLMFQKRLLEARGVAGTGVSAPTEPSVDAVETGAQPAIEGGKSAKTSR